MQGWGKKVPRSGQYDQWQFDFMLYPHESMRLEAVLDMSALSMSGVVMRLVGLLERDAAKIKRLANASAAAAKKAPKRKRAGAR